MDSRTALRHIVGMSGISQRALSRELGKNTRYIATTLASGHVLNTDLMSTIARACGYRLQLVGHGEVLELDGTRREGESEGGKPEA